MLNNEKINIMSRLALYEQKNKEDIRMSKYYKNDFIRLQVLKTVVSVTLGYFFILLMIGIYKAEYIISQAVTLDYVGIGKIILTIYILLLFVYTIITILVCSYKYDKSRRNLSGYYKFLKRLDRIYQEGQIDE
jgi:hypothetical protein